MNIIKEGKNNKYKKSEEEITKEKELIIKAQNGDNDAFDELIAEYQPKFLAIIRSKVGYKNDDVAADIAQNAILNIYKSLDRYDPNHNFYAWTYRIVTNLCIDYLRRYSKYTTYSLTSIEEDPTNYIDQNLIYHDKSEKSIELMNSIDHVFDKMHPKYKRVLILKYAYGLSIKEICKIIDKTNTATRWNIHYARKTFNKIWEELEAV